MNIDMGKAFDLWLQAHTCIALDMGITVRGNDQNPGSVIATIEALGIDFCEPPTKGMMSIMAGECYGMSEEDFNDCYCG